MAVFKCKMCGANLEISENQSVATCDYCGTQQTLPKVDDEKKLGLFNRANNLRIKSEFDKAAGIYESIIAEFPEEAEAFWGLVLCKYGIEYVDDKDGRKIPTCHRTLPTPIMKDEDFQQACENADIGAKAIYREEAKAIDGIQKKILEIAATEEPYDIFICYKETDDVTGARTEDSSIAQDIYTALTEKGYKVFYARNTLRKVAGTEYEPYIYAALSSAKIMLAIGTKYDYYDAVWVKNEWSRFISMMADDSSKILIPCYKDMDAYDIPEEFGNMQALDMADMMFFSSLEASMERILPKEKATVKETVVVNNSASADVLPLLKRAFMFLEDGDWKSADEYCEKVLDLEPENAEAYLGKLMSELRANNTEKLKDMAVPFERSANYQKCIRYGDSKLKEQLHGFIDFINNRNIETAYNKAIKEMQSATDEEGYKSAANQFNALGDFMGSVELAESCLRLAEDARLKKIYDAACAKMSQGTETSLVEAAALFQTIKEYRDSGKLIDDCQRQSVVAKKDGIYYKAVSHMNANRISFYDEAIDLFTEIPGWRDADELLKRCEENKKALVQTTKKAQEQSKFKVSLVRCCWLLVTIFLIAFIVTKTKIMLLLYVVFFVLELILAKVFKKDMEAYKQLKKERKYRSNDGKWQ